MAKFVQCVNHKNTLQKQLCKIKLDLAKSKTFITF